MVVGGAEEMVPKAEVEGAGGGPPEEEVATRDREGQGRRLGELQARLFAADRDAGGTCPSRVLGRACFPT